ncbi:MAG TPA: TolC family protein [Gemmataceae bacterium]|jgi:outer membrane protein TolC|nr:TolC family protein [Gemmataceae bacterium]
MNRCCLRSRPTERAAGWLAFAVLLYAAAPPARAQAAAPAAPAALTLAECVRAALEQQPRIAAERHNIAVAEDFKRALDDLRLAGLVEHGLPTRRRQAELGIAAAAAGADVAERDTVYAVTRTYYTVLFAREQERLARSVVDRLAALNETAEKMLKEGARDVTAAQVKQIGVYLRLARAKQIQAAAGERRALAALKEAIGLGQECHLEVPPDRLPETDQRPCRDDIRALALARRGDLVQALLFAEIACLEVAAQGTSVLSRKETFAAGTDIHATQVPQGSHNGDYRPGAVPPAMPTLLVGARADRVQTARSFHARAGSMVEATRNLISLEAEDAFLRWEEASLQTPPAREAADAADRLAEDLNKDMAAGLRVRPDEVVTARVLAAQARAQYNEVLYHAVLALADLERITAGGFCARLTEAPASRPAPPESKPDK